MNPEKKLDLAKPGIIEILGYKTGITAEPSTQRAFPFLDRAPAKHNKTFFPAGRKSRSEAFVVIKCRDKLQPDWEMFGGRIISRKNPQPLGLSRMSSAVSEKDWPQIYSNVAYAGLELNKLVARSKLSPVTYNAIVWHLFPPSF